MKYEQIDAERHYQLSIYDFLESQEVPPSETVPQVDEAQEIVFTNGSILKCSIPSYEDWTEEELNSLEVGFLPSSDLGTKIPTEDTDLPLFSVGDVLTVRQASEVYNVDSDLEDYYALKEHEGAWVIIEGFDGKVYTTNRAPFYPKELKEIH